jgi:hypothetical protein
MNLLHEPVAGCPLTDEEEIRRQELKPDLGHSWVQASDS